MDPAVIILPTLFASIAFTIKVIVDARSRLRLLQSNSQEGLIHSILEGEERTPAAGGLAVGHRASVRRRRIRSR